MTTITREDFVRQGGSEAEKAQLRAEWDAEHKVIPKAGDLFVGSWGYDQTNTDGLRVVEVSKSGKTATFIQVEADRADHEVDYTRVALKFSHRPVGSGRGWTPTGPIRKTLKWDDNGKPYFRIDRWAGAPFFRLVEDEESRTFSETHPQYGH